jgi:hypothetical protein
VRLVDWLVGLFRDSSREILAVDAVGDPAQVSGIRD